MQCLGTLLRSLKGKHAIQMEPSTFQVAMILQFSSDFTVDIERSQSSRGPILCNVSGIYLHTISGMHCRTQRLTPQYLGTIIMSSFGLCCIHVVLKFI